MDLRLSLHNQTRNAIDRVRSLAESRLARNVGWITAAELVSRIGRIVAAIALARTLDATAFGVAALVLTIFEITRVFTENGIGAAIIRAPAERLAATANTAYRLIWAVCGILFVVQAVIGVIAGTWFARPDLGWMIAALAPVFLMMPFGVVHAYMLQREERFKRLAGVGAAQTSADHVLTALLALCGAGPWAIVLPKLLTAPIWLIGVIWNRPWQRDRSAGYVPLRGLTAFAAPVLAAELATAARDQLDKIIISAMLGLDALGVYYFAFGAGLGLSSSINRGFNAAFYPHLCKAAEAGRSVVEEFRSVGSKAGPVLVFIYTAQATAALIYVPLLFGPAWAPWAGLVAIFCLGGPARLAADATRILLRAQGQTGQELGVTLGFTAAVLAGLVLGAPFGLYGSAIGVTLSASLAAFVLLSRALARPASTGLQVAGAA